MLARAAQAYGAEILLDAEVETVITRAAEATASPSPTERSSRPGVVSALDPRRTFLELVEPRELPSELVDNINRFRFQGTSAKVNFALDGPPGTRRSATAPTSTAGSSTSAPRWSTSSAPMTRRSTAGTARPYIDGAIQSFVDPDMAPPGKHVMSCFIQYAPYHLKESDWDTERDRFGDNVQATLESFFPGFGDLVLHREVVTPLDIERVVGLSEGNIFAGEFLAPQMYFFRPAPGWSQYERPSRVTTSAAPERIPAAASSVRRASRQRTDPQGPQGHRLTRRRRLDDLAHFVSDIARARTPPASGRHGLDAVRR